ncbi:MAG: histidine kinase [Bacteroidales bacterium]|nr:histidine kinase [Bacteroidales bacterium]
MNKNSVEYLPLKKIVILSLVISVCFHLIMLLAFFFGDTLLFNERVKLTTTHHFSLWRLLYILTLNFIFIFTIFMFNRKVLSYSFSKKHYKPLIILLGSIIITASLTSGFLYLSLALSDRQFDVEFVYNILKDSLVRSFTLMTGILLVVQLLKSQHDQRKIAVENETLRSENLLTRFEALKSQLDPHFLFNSLNTLQSLITIDTGKAEDYLQQLSSVLRYTLQNKEVIDLEKELNCAHTYCEMMQIRYGDNLKFSFQIDPKYNNFKVLPLSLLSLVENSVKHNVISSKQPLLVTIATGENSISVSNPIQPKTSPEESNGIGLVNLTERYRLKWDKEVEITNDGTTFCVKLPLQND